MRGGGECGQAQFIQKPARCRQQRLAPLVAQERASQAQSLAGPRDPHEHQPAFLFQLLRVIAPQAAIVGEQSLFDPHDEHHGKLEPLRRVQGHQRDPARRFIDGVEIGHQARVLEEALEGRVVGVVLVVLRGGGAEFGDVRRPLQVGLGISLGGPFLVPRDPQQFVEQWGDPPQRSARETVNHLGEPPQRHDRAAGKAGVLSGVAGRFERGNPLLVGPAQQPVDRRLAQPPGRCVDDPLQRGPVGGVENQPQVRQQVLHLGPFVERQPGGDLVGNAVPAEREFESSRQGVDAIEDREFAPRPLLMLGDLADQRGDSLGLEMLVGEVEGLDRCPLGVHREQLLVLATLVVHDQPVGGPADRLRAAIVLLEPHHLALGEIALELQDVANLGPPPAVDRLVGIARHAQVAMLRRQRPHNHVLGEIRVLVFIDQDVPEPRRQLQPHFLVLDQQPGHMGQQVVEIDGVRSQQQLLVALVSSGGDLVGDAPAPFLQMLREVVR